MKTKTLLVTVAMLMLACQSKKENDTANDNNYDISTMDLSMPAPPACAAPPIHTTVKFVPPVIKDDAVEETSVPSAAKSTLFKNKKIIKDGTMSVKVNNIELAKKRIDRIVKTFNAYYENESFVNNDLQVSYDLKIRVPAKQFESFLQESEKGDGEITQKNINARDVTEEYVDGETRLNSKRLFRTRYNELLSRAGKVDDILAIEENIRLLQEEIESQEGHLKFLDDQVMYSTLEINLFTEKVIVTTPPVKESFFQRFKTSLSNGWNLFVSAILWCVTQWPWIVLFVVFVALVSWYLKRRKK